MNQVIKKTRDSQVYSSIVSRLLRANAWGSLQKVILKLHPTDLGETLGQLSLADRRTILPHILKARKLGKTLLEMPENVRLEILQAMEDALVIKVIDDLPSDEVVEILNVLPRDRVETIVTQVPDRFTRRHLQQMLSYTPDAAGSMMQMEYLALPETDTVEDAVAMIRRRYRDLPIFYLYTLDPESRLSGVISFRQLLLADGNQLLGRIAKRDVVKVYVNEDQAAVAKVVFRYDLLAVPVVNSKNRLVGIITVDDVMDIMEDEVSEDIYKLAGSDVEEMMYGNRIFRISRVRLPWLIVSIGTGLMTAFIIGLFDRALETVITLTSFIPVITGMSGNIGTQAAAITVRGLATGRLLPLNLFNNVWKEIRVGWILGSICGLLVGCFGGLGFGNMSLGLVVGISMMCGMSFAALSGSLMPMIFARWNIDPAVASGPLVTTLNDCVSTTLYLSTATILLDYLK
ncbi:magnesium transporter [bacterium]|nr:magnesium transporter [candidate division CSSED10-310 bacterium]